ncbi:MAG: hypothetical protein VX910_02715 [Candidatus Latescibacterota bacterium]|nr:hypothetical protein [Candidatus Latescibacterota bacterium]
MKALLIAIFTLLSTTSVSGDALDETLALRRQYNAVSARIDSLVRAMEARDAGALETSKLPDGDESLALPENSEVVAIFWADDEAKVWVNDHFVGETRLTPVEVVVPSLYLKSNNVIRARGWDTDLVESGFLFGLYFRNNGALHPIVVSDDSWQGVNGPVETITYAHAMPDIPNAEVIWSDRTFGAIEMKVEFGAGSIRQAAQEIGQAKFEGGESREMTLHAFVVELAMLESDRERLRADLQRRASKLSVVGYSGGQSLTSLTLGKSGPLKESITEPVSRQVKKWTEQLPAEQQALVIPSRRGLRGESEATAAGDRVVGAGRDEDRRADYVAPSDRRNRQFGTEEGRAGASGSGGNGSGVEVGAGTFDGGGFGGRSSRLGLLVPTLLLATYAVYATRQWRRLSRLG